MSSKHKTTAKRLFCAPHAAKLTSKRSALVYIKKQTNLKIVGLISIQKITGLIMHADCEYQIPKISLRCGASNTNEQRSRSGFCERVIRREATETEGLVYCKSL